MKKFFWAMMLALTAVSFVACDKDEPKDDDTEVTVCDKCGQDPCVCEDETGNPDTPDTPDTPAVPDWCTSIVYIETECLETHGDKGYGVEYFLFDDLRTQDNKTIAEALGYASWAEVAAAVEAGDVEYIGYDPGSEADILEDYTSGSYGYWLDSNGARTVWGYDNDSRFYSEGYWSDEEGWCGIYIGVFPGKIAAGDVFVGAMVFQKVDGEDVIRVGIQFTVTVNAFVDPEASQYNGVCTPGVYEFEKDITMSLTEHYDYSTPIVVNLEDLQAKIGLTKYQLSKLETKYDDEGLFFSGLIVETMHADGTPNECLVDKWVQDETGEWYVDGQEMSPSNWLNADSKAVPYGDLTAVMCFDPVRNTSAFGASICVEPSNLGGPFTDEDTGESYGSDAVGEAVGKTISFIQKYTYIPAEAYGEVSEGVVATVKYNVTLTE